ncbi:MAG: N-6 DNA methylase [Thermoflexales bacterium]|nr:N-6 DNA methylase [Thermoflexales bacterium]
MCRLPSSRKEREFLREKGQFWTPAWIAEPMAEYALASKSGLLFDPAVGNGAFFHAAKTIAKEKGLEVHFAGMEIDPIVLSQALEHGLDKDDIALVEIGDFILQPPQAKFSAIVANPPYIRHHRLAPDKKMQLKQLAIRILGKQLDGRAGLHVYFLILALSLLESNGRLAIIVPADTCEGKFAPDLWAWVSRNFALDAVVTFSLEATPFPGIDINPLIFLIRNSPPSNQFLWARCLRPGTDALKRWIRSDFKDVHGSDLLVIVRDLKEGLSNGLSRDPSHADSNSEYFLGDFVRVRRGIATGANDFFFMTAKRAKELGLPEKYLVRAIGRTRDISGDEITSEMIEALERHGRPTLLLALGNEAVDDLPEAVRKYLQEGERLGLPRRPLLARRNPWYRMEYREPPPFLFAYLGRRNSRFIRNTAGVVPLTSFLCVYPKDSRSEHIEQLWRVLNHPDTLANLSRIGKTYGKGAIKVEPRLLEKLSIPNHIIEELGFSVQMHFQKARLTQHKQ